MDLRPTFVVLSENVGGAYQRTLLNMHVYRTAKRPHRKNVKTTDVSMWFGRCVTRKM